MSEPHPIHPACAPGLADMAAQGQSLKQLAAHMERSEAEVLQFLRYYAPEAANLFEAKSAHSERQAPQWAPIQRPIWAIVLRWLLTIPAGLLAFFIAIKMSGLAAWMWLSPAPSRWEIMTFVAMTSAAHAAAFVWAVVLTAPNAKFHVGAAAVVLVLLTSIWLARQGDLYGGPTWALYIACVIAPISAAITAVMAASEASASGGSP